MTPPAAPTVDSEIVAWCDFVAVVEHRNQAARQIGGYFRKLTALSAAPKLEDIWQSIAQQHDKLAKGSHKLWEYWLRLAPARLSAHDRHLLGEFTAVLWLLVQSDEANQRAGRRTVSGCRPLYFFFRVAGQRSDHQKPGSASSSSPRSVFSTRATPALSLTVFS